ncbi:M1 family metallopeptidase [Flavihumibacter rivuli]|uniref:M1 family metallopeptidase n=1 Tax=Flavihumibacter rivuli TaxID=2838156 RepID=UPI001BDF11DF|nr:M1 family metallopeptidase [Flavihumibacter rivuli]ULQ58120.1 M1 family metallopeptidase [Flavihumibacter rivuli]
MNSLNIQSYILASLFILLSQASLAQKPYFQQKADFTITVTLDTRSHTLDGYEEVIYTNNSPDSLSFIWFHIWPNAYKHDKTAFSEQLLTNNRTDFYFSQDNQRGYVNRLDFRVDGQTARVEDHPQHVDIIKIILPSPLPPGQKTRISTPFHVQLPQIFSRSGHHKGFYAITQWYPKPAVYDANGWHPMPYLDQGEFYSEFGDYRVTITAPDNYIIAATGKTPDSSYLYSILNNRTTTPTKDGNKSVKKAVPNKKPTPGNKSNTVRATKQSEATRTIRFEQNNVHDFAWFASKDFMVQKDTLLTPSGKQIDLYSYFTAAGLQTWEKSISYIKSALRFRNSCIGEYPYDIVHVVSGEQSESSAGMEYPTITVVNGGQNAEELDLTIQHEIGHNWFYGALANNERKHTWLDEGLNTYYDNRYMALHYPSGKLPGFLEKRIPADPEKLLLAGLYSTGRDQVANQPADAFNEANYGLINYSKVAEWLFSIEQLIGREAFDSSIRYYYASKKNSHVSPGDLQNCFETVSGKQLDNVFEKLAQQGPVIPGPSRKKLRVTAFFNMKGTDNIQYISLSPLFGFNQYDGVMLGGVIHNYQLPLPKFRFFAAPLYGTKSGSFNYLARASWHKYLDGRIREVSTGLDLAKFTTNNFTTEAENLNLGYQKLAPYIRIDFREKSALDKTERFLQFKSFFFREDVLNFKTIVENGDTLDIIDKSSQDRTLQQLRFFWANHRVLYPYQADLNIEYAKQFTRLSFTGEYFFNFSNRQGGLKARLFAGKFFYNNGKTANKAFETERYHLNLTGPNGYEDYTYSNYFIGRNEYDGFLSQQIMMRDGGFKVRSDLLSSKIGKTDNWLTAMNFNIDIPRKLNPLSIIPIKIPIKVFADIGTFAEAWNDDYEDSRIVFDAGIQVSLFREMVNVYIPVFYSKVFRDYYQSTLGDNRFWKTISFSIDIHQLNTRKIMAKAGL